MIKVGIIGGAGYTAGELIRLLINHSNVEIVFINSSSNAGNKITSVHEGLYGETDMAFTDELPLDKIDLLYFCTAHGDTKKFMESHTLPEDLKIIDLSMDYRIESAEHDFIYGLPELNRSRISQSKHIANPGCFATWAAEQPDKLALLWTNDKNECHRFTFAEMKELTDKTASYFLSLGIKKDDKVMVILKRRYEFWLTIIALHKIGAVIIPATHLLTKKDIVYRNNAADIMTIVADGDELIIGHINDAMPESPSMVHRISIGPVIPEGWEDFHKGIDNAAPFVRPEHAGISKSGSPTSRWIIDIPSFCISFAFSRTSITMNGVICSTCGFVILIIVFFGCKNRKNRWICPIFTSLLIFLCLIFKN